MTGTGSLQRVLRSCVEQAKSPLPPLEEQKAVVAEIEGCQKVIDGARAMVDSCRPHLPVEPAAWCSQCLSHAAERVVIGHLNPDGMLACLLADLPAGKLVTVL